MKIQNLLKKIILNFIFLLIAFFCTIKIIPQEVFFYGTYNGPTLEEMTQLDLITCIESKQCIHQGGFPLKYLIDRDGTSVLGSLGPEDKIIWYKFLGNLLFYYLISISLYYTLKNLIQKK